ncbi:MAG: cbb3-type cytochrome oxidase assembly protein CcoS [Flavobacteriales bacterium]|nr:cbb3-type cytochrome oxidase assembly protein CcoS [Flavobacteriales bacterium]PIE87261.1 MAG: cbb3-type cytochrome oxidase assembly protein CcoS [Bacteroidota bacterium]
MGIIYLMLIVSLIIALFFLVSFLWATKNGQFEDDHTPSIRILFDDENNEQPNYLEDDGSTKV